MKKYETNAHFSAFSLLTQKISLFLFYKVARSEDLYEAYLSARKSFHSPPTSINFRIELCLLFTKPAKSVTD